MSSTSTNFCPHGHLGLDIAKATFEACLLREGRRFCCGFSNTSEGIGKLLAWLGTHASGPVRVALESTGRYGELVTAMLYDAGHRVSVVNPRWIKNHAKAQGRRNKTDRVDAAVIADYVRTHHDLDLWSPPPTEQVTLRELLHRTKELEEMLQCERNRSEGLPANRPLRQSLERITKAIAEEIALLQKAISDHIHSHGQLKADCERLEAIPGIGTKSARWLVAELPRSFASCRSAAAWVGVTPRIHDSGSSVREKPGIGPEGNRLLRSLLYLPAVTARSKNPALKTFADRLSAAGLSKKAVILAVMHKLVRIAFALLKKQSQYDPTYFPQAFAHLQT